MLKKNLAMPKALFLLCTLLFLFSCKKEMKDVPQEIAVTEPAHTDGILPYPFNWEIADFIPTPTGGNPIPVPWGGGASRRFTDDILTDINGIDGWVLLYNLFNTSTFPIPGYFMLYNKYRGLIRIYFYLPNYSPVPSNFITYVISKGGANPGPSSILNFAGNDIVDVAANLPAVSQVQPYQIVATGAWYAAQFELAYDPTIANVNYSDVNLNWQINSTNITQIALDGTQNGTLDGTIQTPASSPDYGSLAMKGIFLATGAYVLDTYPFMFPGPVQTAMKGSVASGLQGVIKNLFSGILGGKTGASTQMVHLNFNSTIKLTGSAVNNSQIFVNSILLPGTIGNQTAPSYSPGYNQPLGVFNITQKPTIRVHTVTTPTRIDHGFDFKVTKDFILDHTTLQEIYNPAVTAEASIQNVKEEIVLVNPNFLPSNTDGILEQVGNSKAYTNVSHYVVSTQAPTPKPTVTFSTVGVRISFDVVPNNGAAKSTIVKTFAANVVEF